MKNVRIIGAFFVPAFDFIRDDGCLLQSHSIEKNADLFTRGCVGELLVGDLPYDLMSDGAISGQRRSDEENGRGEERESFRHLDATPDQLDRQLRAKPFAALLLIVKV